MAFICDDCKKPQADGAKPVKVVLEVRKVKYPPVYDEKGYISRIPSGLETVKELSLCRRCSEKQYIKKIIGEEKVV